MSKAAGSVDRRSFLSTAATALAAIALQETAAAQTQVSTTTIKAVAFDAFAIFDPRSVYRKVEELFPGQGATVSERWRTRQFEYTWLRNSMRDYADFWHVTQDALNYAAEESGITLSSEERTVLMAAYSALKPWPDAAAAVRKLRDRGLRLAVLSNMTPAMMQACLKASGLGEAFELALSTDRVGVFKPDPAAYQIGLDGFRLRRNQIAFAAFGGWDAAGAKRFGYPTFWVNRLGVPAEKLGSSADANCSDLSALPDFIDSL